MSGSDLEDLAAKDGIDVEAEDNNDKAGTGGEQAPDVGDTASILQEEVQDRYLRLMEPYKIDSVAGGICDAADVHIGEGIQCVDQHGLHGRGILDNDKPHIVPRFSMRGFDAVV